MGGMNFHCDLVQLLSKLTNSSHIVILTDNFVKTFYTAIVYYDFCMEFENWVNNKMAFMFFMKHSNSQDCYTSSLVIGGGYTQTSVWNAYALIA